MRFLEPKGLPSPALGRRLGALLERARSHAGLSFRLASAKSGWVAETLGDPRYLCAPGSLAEYEAKSRLPAHIHKIFSLCVLYSLRFSDVLRAAGIETLDASHDPIPDALVGRARPEVLKSAESPPTQGLLHSLVREFEEIPLFLHQSLSVLAGLPGLSMRDLFWARTGRLSRHPLLKDAVFVSVNRRLKKPTVWRHKPLYEQPLYVLLLRDGSYQLAACDLEGSILVVHSFANGSPSPQRLRNGVDVEVIGKITAILRRLQ